jgi:homoserine O-acetyltransferase/O-succinyltransferase
MNWPGRMANFGLLVLLFITAADLRAQQAAVLLASQEGDYSAHDFHCKSGETLPELRLHYTTLGKPVRDANGRVTNAVLILHGTGGSGRSFLVSQFASVLFGTGQLLDASRYFIILPDNIGHGKSSSRATDCTRTFLSTSMTTWSRHYTNYSRRGWGSTICVCWWVPRWAACTPGFGPRLTPTAWTRPCRWPACRSKSLAGTVLAQDGDRWHPGGSGLEERGIQRQTAGLEIGADMLLIAASAPLQMQKNFPTGDAADHYLEEMLPRVTATTDANDLLYALSASRNYDPSLGLEKISVPVMFVNSGDDFINPPELGIAEHEIKRVKNSHFVLIPASEQTHGHGTHTWAEVWQQYLKQLLEESQR